VVFEFLCLFLVLPVLRYLVLLSFYFVVWVVWYRTLAFCDLVAIGVSCRLMFGF